MAKIFTRTKRRLCISTHLKGNKPKIKKKRPKTFKTEAAAKLYAEKHKIKDYSLINLKSPEAKTKKLEIIIK